MVDGSGLENRHTRKGIGGSNPSLSARQSAVCWILEFARRASNPAAQNGRVRNGVELRVSICIIRHRCSLVRRV